METGDKQAFVIWLDPEPQPGIEGEAHLHGRVEHVGSATRAPFSNPKELLDFLERALREAVDARRRDGDGSG